MSTARMNSNATYTDSHRFSADAPRMMDAERNNSFTDIFSYVPRTSVSLVSPLPPDNEAQYRYRRRVYNIS